MAPVRSRNGPVATIVLCSRTPDGHSEWLEIRMRSHATQALATSVAAEKATRLQKRCIGAKTHVHGCRALPLTLRVFRDIQVIVPCYDP